MMNVVIEEDDSTPLEALFFDVNGEKFRGRIELSPVLASEAKSQVSLHRSVFDEDCIISMVLGDRHLILFIAKGQIERGLDHDEARAQLIDAFKRLAPASGSSDPRLAERINSMRDQLNAMKQEKESLAHTVENLNDRLDSSQKKNSQLQTQLGTLLSELEDISKTQKATDKRHPDSHDLPAVVPQPAAAPQPDAQLKAAHDELQTKYDLLLVRSKDNEKKLLAKVKSLQHKLKSQPPSGGGGEGGGPVRVVEVVSNDRSQQEIILTSELNMLRDKHEVLARELEALQSSSSRDDHDQTAKNLLSRLED